MGWYKDNSGSKTHPVGQRMANGYGLFDMSGHVWEWTWDNYDSGAYAGGAATDPAGPASGSGRVSRGGCLYYVPQSTRVAIRNNFSPGFRSGILGFRLVRTAG